MGQNHGGGRLGMAAPALNIQLAAHLSRRIRCSIASSNSMGLSQSKYGFYD
jgi:hypothetical protein